MLHNQLKINENEFIITLNYLRKYQNLFENENLRDILERVPQTLKKLLNLFLILIFLIQLLNFQIGQKD